MRSLNAGQIAATAPVRTDPNYFININLDNQYQWMSSAPSFGTEPGPVLMGPVSGDRATIYVHNEDYRHTQNVVEGVYLGGFVAISWAYGEEARILIFTGIITSIPECDDWLQIDCEREGPRVYPRGRFLPPSFNHLPPPGYSVEFDGAMITIGD